MKNRLVFPLFSILLVSLLFLPNAFSEDTVVRVAPQAVHNHGDPYLVDIFIENGQNVAGYQVILQFDSNDFKASSEGDIEVDYGDYLPADAFFGKPQIIDDDPTDSLKVILFAATSHTSESNGDGFLARLIFNKGTTSRSDSFLTLLNGTLLSNRAGETSVPRLEKSETFPSIVRDLVVESVQAIPKDAKEARDDYGKGDEFNLHATVRNIGNSLTHVDQLIISGPDSTTKKHDQNLKPNDTVELSLPIDALTDTGTYYYKVCVTSHSNETNEDNNCYTIKIEVEPPDLEIISLWTVGYDTALPGKNTVLPGDKFKLLASVSNSGRKSDKTVLWWYYHGKEKTGSPEELGASRIDSLPQIIVTAPEEPGIYYYSACVDSVEDELKTENNCSGTVEITVGKPNLEVQIQAFQGNFSLKGKDISPDTKFKLYVTVTNRGPGKSKRTELNLYRSVNKVAPRSDEEKVFIEYHNVAPLTENEKYEEFLEIKAPRTVGSYYYHAVANESDTHNNWSFKGVDLTVEKDHVVFGDVNLTLPPNFISDVAFTPNWTYFVLNPQFAKVEGGNNEDYFHHKCIITLYNIPNTLDDTDPTGNLPKEFPYLMLPFKTPKEEADKASEEVDTAKKDAVAALGDEILFTMIGYIPGLGDIIGITSTIGNITSALLGIQDANQLEENKRQELWNQLASPKVEVADYSRFFDKEADSKSVDNTNPIFFMIPSHLTSIGVELCQQLYRKDELIEIRIETGTKVQKVWIPGYSRQFLARLSPSRKLTDILKNYVDELSDSRIDETDKTYIQQRIEDLRKVFNLSKNTFLETYLSFWINLIQGSFFSNLFSSDDDPVVRYTDLTQISSRNDVRKTYAGYPKIAMYRDILNLKDIWRSENPGPAAPHVKPMSLADYPPFQQLSPEIQGYLLQHFEGTANPKTINTETRQMPEKTTLLPNYPNPFNPETWIPYQLANPADVALTIYDIQGRVVCDLDLGHQRAGMYQSRARAAHWDGKNAQGEPVASGLYFYTLKAGEFTATRKMLIRK